MNDQTIPVRLLARALFEYVDAGGKATAQREPGRVTFELGQEEFLDKIVQDALNETRGMDSAPLAS